MKNFKSYIAPFLISILLFTLSSILLSSFSDASGPIKLLLEVKVTQNDQFQVFYKTNAIKNFGQKAVVSLPVVGKAKSQLLEFTLPNQITDLRIDFGNNVQNTPIELQRLELKSGGTSYRLDKQLLNYFELNECIAYDDGQLVTKTTNVYDPFIYSKDLGHVFAGLRKERGKVKWPFTLSFIFAFALLLALVYSKRNVFKTLTPALTCIVLWIAMLWIPNSVLLLVEATIDNNLENRELKKKPRWSLAKGFSSAYESYFNDNFGLRPQIIKFASELKLSIFGTSPKPDKVMFGNNQFMFFNKEEVYVSYSHSDLFSPRELKQKVGNLKTIEQDLAKRNIKFLCAFWPNKHSIYPEYMPFAMQLQQIGDLSLADQLVNEAKRQKLTFIDVRPEMLQAKSKYQLYLKFDTHWNANGGYEAYKAFFNKTYKIFGVKPLKRSAFNISKSVVRGGDLTIMLAIDSLKGYKDLKPKYTLKNKQKNYRHLDVGPGYPEHTFITQNDACGNKEILLVFGDSYTEAIKHFFSLHFYQVYYIRSSYDIQFVNRIKPNYVLLSPVERFIRKRISK